MNLKIEECINATTALNLIMKENDLPFMFKWKLDDIVKALEVHVKRGQEEQLKLLKEYGKPAEKNPNEYSIEPDNVSVYLDELNVVFGVEVDVNVTKINKKDFIKHNVLIPKQVSIDMLRPIMTDEV